MDAEKRKRYENIASELTRLAGGKSNILGIAHCGHASCALCWRITTRRTFTLLRM